MASAVRGRARRGTGPWPAGRFSGGGLCLSIVLGALQFLFCRRRSMATATWFSHRLHKTQLFRAVSIAVAGTERRVCREPSLSGPSSGWRRRRGRPGSDKRRCGGHCWQTGVSSNTRQASRAAVPQSDAPSSRLSTSRARRASTPPQALRRRRRVFGSRKEVKKTAQLRNVRMSLQRRSRTACGSGDVQTGG